MEVEELTCSLRSGHCHRSHRVLQQYEDYCSLTELKCMNEPWVEQDPTYGRNLLRNNLGLALLLLNYGYIPVKRNGVRIVETRDDAKHPLVGREQVPGGRARARCEFITPRRSLRWGLWRFWLLGWGLDWFTRNPGWRSRW